METCPYSQQQTCLMYFAVGGCDSYQKGLDDLHIQIKGNITRKNHEWTIMRKIEADKLIKCWHRSRISRLFQNLQGSFLKTSNVPALELPHQNLRNIC